MWLLDLFDAKWPWPWLLNASHFCRGQASVVQCLEWEVERSQCQQWFRQRHRGSVHGNASVARPCSAPGAAHFPGEKMKDGLCEREGKCPENHQRPEVSEMFRCSWSVFTVLNSHLSHIHVGWSKGSMKALFIPHARWWWPSPERIQIKTESPMDFIYN